MRLKEALNQWLRSVRLALHPARRFLQRFLNGHTSITFRLTLLFSAVSTVVLLLLGVLVGKLAERHFEEMDMVLLNGKLELVQHVLRRAPLGQGKNTLSGQLNDVLIGSHGLMVTVVGPDRKPIFSFGEGGFPQSLIAPDAQQPVVLTSWANTDNQHFRGIAAAVAADVPAIGNVPPTIIAVATDTAHHEHFMYSFRLALWAVVALVALLTGFLGWVAARRGLAPLKEMRQRAAAITANRLDQRLAVSAMPIELAEVAESLNAMLARLEASFLRLSDFSSDLAHELRTPVSNLLTQTQVMLSRPRTREEYQDVLVSNVEEFERLSRMIADMLFLAKSDNHLIVPHCEPVDLMAEVASLCEFYEALVEEKGVSLTHSGKGVVQGDRLMLRRAVNNLLSNAVRHTPDQGRIAIEVDDSAADCVMVTVENTGAVIAPVHLPRLFDRFYRAEPARQNVGEGAGLGLAITRSIVRAHGGDVSVRSTGGVTVFAMRLPT